MLMICITIYLIVILVLAAFVWAALVVAKRNDAQVRSGLLHDQISPAESSSER